MLSEVSEVAETKPKTHKVNYLKLIQSALKIYEHTGQPIAAHVNILEEVKKFQSLQNHTKTNFIGSHRVNYHKTTKPTVAPVLPTSLITSSPSLYSFHTPLPGKMRLKSQALLKPLPVASTHVSKVQKTPVEHQKQTAKHGVTHLNKFYVATVRNVSSDSNTPIDVVAPDDDSTAAPATLSAPDENSTAAPAAPDALSALATPDDDGTAAPAVPDGVALHDMGDSVALKRALRVQKRSEKKAVKAAARREKFAQSPPPPPVRRVVEPVVQAPVVVKLTFQQVKKRAQELLEQLKQRQYNHKQM